jgi:hypothetical protein
MFQTTNQYSHGIQCNKKFFRVSRSTRTPLDGTAPGVHGWAGQSRQSMRIAIEPFGLKHIEWDGLVNL